MCDCKCLIFIYIICSVLYVRVCMNFGVSVVGHILHIYIYILFYKYLRWIYVFIVIFGIYNSSKSCTTFCSGPYMVDNLSKRGPQARSWSYSWSSSSVPVPHRTTHISNFDMVEHQTSTIPEANELNEPAVLPPPSYA